MQHSNIRELAYKIWLAKGCPEGTAEEDWRAAERQLASSGAPAPEAAAPKPDPSSVKSNSSPAKTAPSSAKPVSSSPARASLPGSSVATAAVGAASKGVDDTSKGSFPASDPPASHLPDKPPSNADEKWNAAGLPPKQTTRRPTKPQAPRTQGR